MAALSRYIYFFLIWLCWRIVLFWLIEARICSHGAGFCVLKTSKANCSHENQSSAQKLIAMLLSLIDLINQSLCCSCFVHAFYISLLAHRKSYFPFYLIKSQLTWFLQVYDGLILNDTKCLSEDQESLVLYKHIRQEMLMEMKVLMQPRERVASSSQGNAKTGT